MMEHASAKKEYLKKTAERKLLVIPAIFVAALFMASCFAAIPIAIKYYKDKNQTKAEAEMPVPAEKVYSTAVEMAKEKDLKIVKEEDDKMYLEVTDGVQTASLKAEAAGSDKTNITVIANLPSQEGEEKEQRKEKEKELTLRIVNRICDRLEVKCTITKE
jgi:cation transport regulator ChaB